MKGIFDNPSVKALIEKYINEVAIVTSIMSATSFVQLRDSKFGDAYGSIACHEQIATWAVNFVDEHRTYEIFDWEAYAESKGGDFYNRYPCWDDFVIKCAEISLINLLNN